MSSTVFILDHQNALSPLMQSDFASEDLFQKILADHPTLLSAIAGEGEARRVFGVS